MNSEIMKGQIAIAETKGRVARELKEVQEIFEEELVNLGMGKPPRFKGVIAGAAKANLALVNNARAASSGLKPELIVKAVKFVQRNSAWLAEHNIPLNQNMEILELVNHDFKHTCGDFSVAVIAIHDRNNLSMKWTK